MECEQRKDKCVSFQFQLLVPAGMGVACSEISREPDVAQMEVEYEALIALCSLT